MSQAYEKTVRFPTNLTVAVTASINTTGEINMLGFAGGHFGVPAGSGLTSITWYDKSANAAGEKVGSYTEANAAITQTVAAGRGYPIPVALFGCAYLYPVGNTTGTIIVDLAS